MRSYDSIGARLAFVRIDEETRAALRELQPLIARELPGILDQFYAHISLFPETAQFFSNQVHMGQAKQAQIRHWAMIASATFDELYVRAVTKIGETHNRIGLEPRWYIGGYSFILTGLLRAIEIGIAEGWLGGKATREKKALLQNAIAKAALLDMELSISIYLQRGAEFCGGGSSQGGNRQSGTQRGREESRRGKSCGREESRRGKSHGREEGDGGKSRCGEKGRGR